MKKIFSIVGIVLLFITGVSLMLYPNISNFLAKQNQSVAIQDYDKAMSDLTATQIEEERQKAEDYNKALSGQEITDPFIPGSGMVLPENYSSVLNLNESIGFVKIPVIDVSLPIYHGTSDLVLKKGLGHMEMTAFPIGGEGNHSVLTGHSGLPSAILLTDLDKVKIRDVFYIHILNEILAYEVDQILVVSPDNTEDLRPVKGEDYVSLITCTPYGINSHRLIVRGIRIPYIAESETEENAVEKSINFYLIIIVILIIVLLVFCVIFKFIKRRK